MNKKLLGNLDQGLLFVISAPAGTGKTTLVDMMLEEFPDTVAQSCSCTTRPPRQGEIPGKHYHFISLDAFKDKIGKGEFLEYAEVFGNYYGTLKKEITDLQKEKKHVVLVIDTQGAMQIKRQIKRNMPAVFIFISPPSLEELRRRLFKRRTESEEKMLERLDWAEQELKFAREYDYHIVNDDLATTYQIIRSIFIAEEHKNRR